MHDARIESGTTMTYEKRVLGMTIRGFGRYDLHRPGKQSTFAFWSDDPRSLIRRGVGLWRYVPMGDGTVLFSSSHTYTVRWGLAGRWIDRLFFRPLFCRLTEASVRRLVREHAGDSAAPSEGVPDVRHGEPGVEASEDAASTSAAPPSRIRPRMPRKTRNDRFRESRPRTDVRRW
jgi:hypothetical protein